MMSVAHTETNTAQLTLNLIAGGNQEVPDWIKELRTRGWTIVRAISEENAFAYANEAYHWLEDWGLGFDRNDPSTHISAHLPAHARGGIYHRYGLAHEQFVWDIKTEPGVIDKFAHIWGTDELMVSFDTMNLSIPDPTRSTSDPVFKPWSHVDQSPYRKNFHCIQGIVNLLPNGPDDGGLMVLEGSNNHYTELWEHFDHKQGAKGWNTWEQQMLDDEMCDWLISKGCKWEKVCAEPGELMLWDSRTVHYGATPRSTNNRFAAYVCYKPACTIPEDVKAKRLEVFAGKHSTAHDPAIIRVNPRMPMEDHPSYATAVNRPLQNPVLSKRARQLIGLESY